MNCDQANTQIQIADYLAKSGIQPATTKGRTLVYLSPIRNEKTASFFVYPDQNRWHDFGTGTSGKLIDLVCQMHRVSVPGALLILSGVEIPKQSLSFARQKEETHRAPVIELKHLQSLQNRALIQYIESRKIPATLAAKYCQEAYYQVTNIDSGEQKRYFALAFANDRGGYELRNKYFKGGASPKTISTIPGSLQKVNVFEGWIDFLSALVYYGQPAPQATTIVLNSLSHIKHLYDILPNFDRITLCLDNDEAGKEATAKIISRFPEAIDQAAQIYPKSKDFNAFLINK
jgi:hypothetical protein